MAKPRKPTKTALNRLARLKRLPEFVLEGGLRTLDVYVRENGEYLKPQAAVWVDARGGYVRGALVINPQHDAEGGIDEALVSLVDSVAWPLHVPQHKAAMLLGAEATTPGDDDSTAPPFPAGLPERIVLNNSVLVEAATPIFAPLGVSIAYAEELPAFDAAFASLAEHMGADPNAAPPEPFAWEIDTTILAPLYKAVDRYAKLAPWEFMPDNPPVEITLGANGPQDSVETLYASILGAAGEVFGVAFYYSIDDYWKAVDSGTGLRALEDESFALSLLQSMGLPIDGLGSLGILPLSDIGAIEGGDDMESEQQPMDYGNCLVFYLDAKEGVDADYLRWMKERKLKYTRDNVPTFLRTAPDAEPRQPDERETRALSAALDALNALIENFEDRLQTPFTPDDAVELSQSGPGIPNYSVYYPPQGYDWERHSEVIGDPYENGALPPASPEAASTIYRFQVKLDWNKSVWRRIELRGDQTLDDLHSAIQDAFGWDDDHLYAFFLSGKAWDGTSEFASPRSDGPSAASFRLENLVLWPGQQFLYIFDFGDELRHRVKLEAITPDAALPDMSYPRITERRGENVPQYDTLDE